VVIEVQDEMPGLSTALEAGSTSLSAAAGDMRTAGPFPVEGTTGHPARGSVQLYEQEGVVTIRFEDFSTINGPNLHLYLAKDLEASEFIDLGPIRGTKGNINYVVPEGVDLSTYSYILHWCVPFSVLFNYARIQ
jgi:hypothetical protein